MLLRLSASVLLSLVLFSADAVETELEITATAAAVAVDDGVPAAVRLVATFRASFAPSVEPLPLQDALARA